MTKKKLKKQNKELREDIQKIIFGSWADMVRIRTKYMQRKDFERAVWSGGGKSMTDITTNR